MINTKRLRCTLGVLALLLPWIVCLLLWDIPPSISATYYTYEAGPVFMIILGASSFLLFSYKGYERQDDIVYSLAGIFGICICLFPTEVKSLHLDYVGTFQLPVKVSEILHCTSAITFFVLLAYGSLFLFTKGDVNPTKNKKIRNIIFRVCGIGMILSFTLLLIPKSVLYCKVWLVEAIALFFFGVSFLTKANCFKWLFAD